MQLVNICRKGDKKMPKSLAYGTFGKKGFEYYPTLLCAGYKLLRLKICISMKLNVPVSVKGSIFKASLTLNICM